MARKSTTRKTTTPSATSSTRRSNKVMSWSLKKSHSPNDASSKGFFENMLHSLRTTGRNALSTRQVYAHILETIVAKANELEQDGYEVLRIYGGTGVPNNMESTLGTLGFYLQKTTDFTIQYKRSKASKKKGVIRYAFRTKATTNAHKNDSWVDTFTSTHDVMSVVRDDNIHTLTELLSFKSKIKPRYGFTRVVIFYRE